MGADTANRLGFQSPNKDNYGTSRDRPKSAPYPRLKNSKRTSKCQFTVLENRKAKKMDRVALWDFSTSILSQNSKKNEEGPFEEKNFWKKSLAVPKKNWKGDPLVSPGMVCYAGKQEKLFWFSSLDEIVQFGAILFCRTILVSSCGLEKKEKPL